MNINQVSFGFTTNKVQETKEFYEKYLGATTIFEKDGYACLKLGDISNHYCLVISRIITVGYETGHSRFLT